MTAPSEQPTAAVTTVAYDVARAGALWLNPDDGERIARHLWGAVQVHKDHLPCTREACVRNVTLDLAFPPWRGNLQEQARAALLEALVPLVEDFNAQVAEALDRRDAERVRP